MIFDGDELAKFEQANHWTVFGDSYGENVNM